MFTPESYSIIISLFPRILGLIYLFAFGAFLFQIKGLLCKNGLLPIDRFLTMVKTRLPRRCYFLVPSILWFNNSDKMIIGAVVAGTLLSILLMLGVFPPLLLLLLFILYISIVSTGQDFLGFGWEGFLLEITANAFLLSLDPFNILVWLSLNLVLFRFHFQGGIVKLESGDPNWRNLTGVAYHYQSQPIPNALAWYVHKLPMWFHKFSTLLMLIIEIPIAFAIFGTDLMRLWVFFAFFGLQWSIWITGNFSYLNHMTVVLSTILIADQYITSWLPFSVFVPSVPFAVSLLCYIGGAILLSLQFMQLWQHFLPNKWIARCFFQIGQFHLANRYGIFAVMTTTRHEIVFEGSDDGIIWKEYTFWYKPSEITRRPRRISPYQPRIDWQAWFLPLGSYRHDPWFAEFIYHLLKGTPDVLKLIRGNPFSEKPPQFVRSLIYDYKFSTFQEKKEFGWWWKRNYVGVFTRPVSLEL